MSAGPYDGEYADTLAKWVEDGFDLVGPCPVCATEVGAMHGANGSYQAIVHCEHRAEVDQLLAELVTQRNGNGTRPHPTANPESTSQPEAKRSLQPDRAEIDKALRLFCEPGEVYELRAPNTKQGTVSGYFDDFAALAQAAIRANQPALGAPGIYFTINPVRRDLLARSANAAKPYAKHTTADTDIVRRCFFFIDLDSVRAAGISATETEHEAALQLAVRVRAYLTNRGWPQPMTCDSGNGAWLIYRINLPNDGAATALIKRVLEALALTFDDETVAVDRTTFNAGRIVKIPGTAARKGSDLTERPHRLSRVIDAGSTDVVSREQLEEIAALVPDPPPRNSSSERASQSLAEWIAAHGIAVKRELSWNGGTRFILENCIFDPSHHGTSAALIEMAGGAKVYRCLHNGCVDRKWSDVRELFEPGYRERPRAKSSAHLGEQDEPDDEPSGAESEEWSDPESIDTGLLPVPAFDLRLIPPALRPWIADIADRAQCPLDFLGMGAIVSAGALVARTLAIRPKRYDDWPVVSNLWGGIIAPPGFLKSPMIAEILKPVRSLAYDAAKRFEQAKRDYENNVVVENAKRANIEQEIKAVLKEKVAGGPAAEKTRDATIETLRAKLAELASEPPRQARFEITDPSVEKLGEILNQNPGGVLLVRDELTGFLRSLERQGHEGDRAFYCEAWNGLSPYSFDRIGRGTVHIRRICVSIFGGIQPGKWNSYLREAFTDGENDGFMNRFQMTAWPDRSGPWHNVDRWPDTVAKKAAVSIYKALAELKPEDLGAEPTEVGEFPYLRFTPAAQDLFNAWRSDLEAKVRHPEEHPILVSHLGKYRSLMPALALVFHAIARVADSDDSIGVSQSAATLSAAWCDYLEAHARRCYQSVTDATNSAAAALALKVRRGKLTSPFSARDVYRAGWEGLSDKDDAWRAIDVLEKAHWLRREVLNPPNGKPSTQFRINPKVLEAEK